MHAGPLSLLSSDDRTDSSVIRDLLAQARHPHVHSLAGGLPAAELLPTERLGRSVATVLETYGPRALQYGLSAGEPELLTGLAAYADSTPERLLVTAGSQQALDLLARVLAPGRPPRIDVEGTVAGLRIGWANAEERVITRLTLAKQAADLHTSTMNQLVVADMVARRDWWAQHLSRLRHHYRRRRSALRAAVDRLLPEATVAPQHGGFFLWVDLHRQDLDLMDLLPRAVEAGTAFVPGSAFAVGTGSAGRPPSCSTLRLSYSNGDTDSFEEALTRLVGVLG